MRRNEDIKGSWIIPSRRKTFNLLKIENSSLSIEKDIQNPSVINRKDLILPGFDKNGQSWLYNSINRCRNVGMFIAEIETIQNRLKSKYQYEIDWLNWIDKHFITLDEQIIYFIKKRENNYQN